MAQSAKLTKYIAYQIHGFSLLNDNPIIDIRAVYPALAPFS
ncbi:hypothetical protein ACPV37_06795 [Vibrio mediterranei]